MERVTNTQIATIAVRWMLGLLFTMAGWWKVFELSATEHARQFFVQGFADSWIPEWLLWSLGVSIPFVELAAGLLLLVGWRIRETLAVLAGLLLVTTYGHTLQQPLFDIDGHTFTRFALIVFLLCQTEDSHRLSIDRWMAR